ncbi:transcriptional regulator [bacterium]|nr:transcriptional regulator [candidate division CSSED10-310 bacterium]
MQLHEIVKLLGAEVLVGAGDLDREISAVHASDLISHVLATCTRGALWLTGLLDSQIVNTAELFDLSAVVFVANRRPTQDIIEAAEMENVPVLCTQYTMFESCGLLYSKGLKPSRRCG